MHTGRRYGVWETLYWSRRELLLPFAWATSVTCAFEILSLRFLAIPTLPMSLVGIAVAFYLGFKNNASYDRLWEARKIWGAIVNSSRSWAYGARDLLGANLSEELSGSELEQVRAELIHRHVAWMDALRHQLRQVKSWEHDSEAYQKLRKGTQVAEYHESLEEVLRRNLTEPEAFAVLVQINPAAHLLAHQSGHLRRLRRDGWIDGFSHMHLQGILDELMAQQGKAERIKNFPFPRQYATVNSFFAFAFMLLLPFGLLNPFHEMDALSIWMVIPFSVLVSWVFLTTDKIGDWSENPFEGLANDVPITQMARGIERDMLQILGETELPPARESRGKLLF